MLILNMRMIILITTITSLLLLIPVKLLKLVSQIATKMKERTKMVTQNIVMTILMVTMKKTLQLQNVVLMVVGPKVVAAKNVVIFLQVP